VISVTRISKDEVMLKLSEKVTPEQVDRVFRDILNGAFQRVVVDCSGLMHFGHRILGKLYMFNMDLRISRRKLILSGCSEEMRSLLHLTKIDERIEIARQPPQHPKEAKEQPNP
jgi:anti-anti-sigma regulatory factor